jgi:flagellar hook assembly protein FlgD
MRLWHQQGKNLSEFKLLDKHPSVGATPGIANKSQCDEAADNSNSYVEVWPKSLKRSSENFRWVNVKSDQLKKCNINIYSSNGELVYSMNFEGDFRGAWEGIDSSNNTLFPGNYVLNINGEAVNGNAIHERELVVILE